MPTEEGRLKHRLYMRERRKNSLVREQDRKIAREWYARRLVVNRESGKFKARRYRRDSVKELVCSVCGGKFTGLPARKTCSPECFKQAERQHHLKRLAANVYITSGRSDIEMVLWEVFEKLGLSVSYARECRDSLVKSQFLVRGSDGTPRYSVDYAIPSEKIAIECDSDWWHGIGRYKDFSGPIQRKARRNDRNKSAYLESHGWKLLRFTEAEIKSYEGPGLCSKKVLEVLKLCPSFSLAGN